MRASDTADLPLRCPGDSNPLQCRYERDRSREQRNQHFAHRVNECGHAIQPPEWIDTDRLGHALRSRQISSCELCQMIRSLA